MTRGCTEIGRDEGGGRRGGVAVGAVFFFLLLLLFFLFCVEWSMCWLLFRFRLVCSRVGGGVLVGWVCWRLGGCDRELVIMISEKVCDARAEHGESLDQMFLYSGGVRLCFA